MTNPGTLPPPALGSGFLQDTLRRLNEILETARRSSPAFADVVRFRVYANPAADCISLVAAMANGQDYQHPRFVTLQEIFNGTWKDNLSEKLLSTINGTPWEPVERRIMPENSFSLQELEQAQELIDACKS